MGFPLITEAPSAKQRFITLDALRGVGAICVMTGHSGVQLGGYRPTHFYLAVDMFFLLSGFVIAHAYDKRLASGYSASQFFRARFFRLYPIYVIGLAIGLGCTFVVNAHALTDGQVVESTIFAVVGLPSPPMGPWKALFPLNGPFWSLFFEFWIANLAYGLMWKQLFGRRLWGVVILSAAATLVFAVIFRTADSGWNWHTFPGGVARVSFSFFAGVALSRLQGAVSHRLSFPSWACLAAGAIALSLPIGGVAGHLYDEVAILLFFPALIFFAARAKESRPYVGKMLGNLSYCVYAIHRPLLGPAIVLITKLGYPTRSYLVAIAYQIVFVAFVLALAWLLNSLVETFRKSGAPIPTGQPAA